MLTLRATVSRGRNSTAPPSHPLNMLESLREGDGHRAIDTDVCIVGAGAAGITLARSFLGTTHDVCLLESGGEDFDSRTQKLYAGANIGAPYYALDEARLRFFGGTTHIWGGRCCPLDEIDFRARPWVPHSGWPLNRADLLPWYTLAQRDLELGRFEYGAGCWNELAERPPALDPDTLQFGFWRFDRLNGRFALSRCGDLVKSANIRVLCHANLTHLQAEPGARRIAHLDVKSICGRTARINAGYVVLACGGIENARLLLASNDIESSGIGNAHDQVGRYFMEHPHARAARVDATSAFALYQLFQRRRASSGTWLAPSLKASESAQARAGILNTALTLKLLRPAGKAAPVTKRLYRVAKHSMDPDQVGRGLWRMFRNVRHAMRARGLKRLRWWNARLDGRTLYLFARGEQAPNPASRVLLDGTRDALGVPRAALDWRLAGIDKHSVRTLVGMVSDGFSRAGIARVTPEPWLDDQSLEWPVEAAASNHPLGGYHHMGTTRMSEQPDTGVVNMDCRVHRNDNLYIAGSSVFPTGGWANPTLTIIALCHRMGAHLRDRLR